MAGRERGGRLTIGGVLEELRPDFPDVSISKIRFLEAEGLLQPERTRSGYRSFSRGDVDRLRYILTAQRDRYWPLKVIREALDALDRGLEPAGPDAVSERPSVPTAEADGDVPEVEELRRPRRDVRLTAAEIRDAAGLDGRTFEALVGYGLLQSGPDGHFSVDALPVARAAATLGSHGIEPRHLRAFRTAADREIGLVQQIVAPLRGRDPERHDEMAAELAHECLALHAALVKTALHR